MPSSFHNGVEGAFTFEAPAKQLAPPKVYSPSAPAKSSPPPPIQPPSFDCSLASSAAEKMTCSNSQLADADRHMKWTYDNLMKTAKNDSDRLAVRQAQREFLALRDRCIDAKCVLKAYNTRIVNMGVQIGNLRNKYIFESEQDEIAARELNDRRRAAEKEKARIQNTLPPRCSNWRYYPKCLESCADSIYAGTSEEQSCRGLCQTNLEYDVGPCTPD